MFDKMDLEIEYKQWLFITTDLYNFIYNELSTEKDQECRNIFQHWLLMVNQDKSLQKYKYYPLLPRVKLSNEKESNSIAMSLVNAVEEKKFFWNHNLSRAYTAVQNILNYIDDCHEKYTYEELNLVPYRNDGLLCLEKFRGKNFVNLPYLLNNFKDDVIIRMILRYESVGNGSYQWGDPKELHMLLYEEYYVRYEGFASPFNSRFISVRDCKFCSLFPDTDEVFGSLGNFFNLDLAEYPGAWSVNPPFINDVMEKVSDKLIKALNSGVKSTFFVTYPYWKDSNGWLKLENSRFLLESFHRENNTVVQDAYGRIFSPACGLSLFCISHYPELNLNSVADILNKTIQDFV